MNEYATLAMIREWLASSTLTMGTGDDGALLRYLGLASRAVDRFCGDRVFYPRIETRRLDYQRDSRDMWVDDDLLEVTTLTVDGTAVAAADFEVYPLNGYPKSMVNMNYGGGSVYEYSETPQAAVSVLGVWGYHSDWDNAWESVDTVQDDPLTTAATSLTLGDVDGAGLDGLTPRISAGNLLKIGSEYLGVTATDTDNNTTTVRRGINGSTAAEHANGAAVSVFRVEDVVVLATLGLVKYVFEMRTATGGVVALPGVGGAAIRAAAKFVLEDFDLPVRIPDLMGFDY